MSPSEGPAALQPVCTVHRTRVTTNLGLWERNAIYGRNANVWRLGRCVRVASSKSEVVDVSSVVNTRAQSQRFLPPTLQLRERAACPSP